MTEVTMPKLSDTMTEGTFVSWKKNKGDRVERGDIIAEVETDKANMELEAFASGVLLETFVSAGEAVAVGKVIALIGDPSEQRSEQPKQAASPAPEAAGAEPVPQAKAAAYAAAPPAEGTSEPSSVARKPQDLREERKVEQALEGEGEGVTATVEQKMGTAPQSQAQTGQQPEPQQPAPLREAAPAHPAPAAGAEKASPLVRRLARERGIDLSQITGSGPDGRILQEDLEQPASAATPEAAKPAATPYEAPAQPPQGAQPLSRMRAAIARKVSATWQTVPHFTVTTAIDMGITEALHRELKAAGNPLSINDFILKASAAALRRYPQMNSSLLDEKMVIHDEINIGIAASIEQGLVIPVVKGCDRLPLLQVGQASRALIDRARSGRLTEDDMRGGTFTVSNLGMYGVEQFTAIINSPEAAILAVGAIMDRLVLKEGRTEPARVMKVSLSADHRLVDGAYAALFLEELKHILENPALILV